MRKLRVTTVVAAVVALVAGGASAAQAATLQEVSGTTHGTVFRSLSAPGTPLLARFQYHFSDSDHHIRQIAAMPLPQQSQVEVTFADENGDDNYSYRVSSEYTDPAGIQPAAFHGSCTGQCTVPLFTRPPGDFLFVLTGFRFGFDNGDHHFDKLAVTESNAFLTTSFRDQNGDDPYTFDVSYAWVPRARLGTIAEVSGSVHAAGQATVGASAGEKVIRGFSVDNLASGNAGDNHIRDLGILANATSFDILYGDDNPGDSADWGYQVQYATVL